jgi:hypothetical protein
MMSWTRSRQFFNDITRLDKSKFSLTAGLTDAAFDIAPAILALAIQQPALFLTTFGAIFFTFIEEQLPGISTRFLIVACFIGSAAFGLGTLAATTSHLLSIFLLGIAVFAALTTRVSTKWAPVGSITAMIFAVGVGLPGSSIQSAGERTLFPLIGMLWALLGVEIHRFALSHRRILQQQPLSESKSATIGGVSSNEGQATPRLEVLRSALLIGIASALGYAIGLALGFPRDYWVVITIILAVRPSLSLTITSTSMIVIGTLAGAMIAAVITLEISNPYLLLALLFSFAVMTFATRGVNMMLMQIFFAPFIIILLNIYYPGEWYLSFIRIVNVAIGGAIAVAMVYLLTALSGSNFSGKNKKP